MSHEIRTPPLNAVIGLTSLMMDTPPLSEGQRQYAQGVKAPARSC